MSKHLTLCHYVHVVSALIVASIDFYRDARVHCLQGAGVRVLSMGEVGGMQG